MLVSPMACYLLRDYCTDQWGTAHRRRPLHSTITLNLVMGMTVNTNQSSRGNLFHIVRLRRGVNKVGEYEQPREKEIHLYFIGLNGRALLTAQVRGETFLSIKFIIEPIDSRTKATCSFECR